MATAPPKAATTTEPAVEKTQPTLKRDRGTVKSVLSGDTLVVLEDKPSTTGPPADKIITLSSLQAPRFARGEVKQDEAWAWESREFLRKKVVGKKIQYAIDHTTTGGREYVTAYLAPVAGFDPECINHSVVSEGWATVHNKDAKRAEALVQLEDQAMQDGKGIHAKDKPKPLGKNDEDSDTLYKQLKGKQVSAIVEQVRTGSSVRVTVLPSRHQFQILLSGVQTPGWRKPEGVAEPQPEPFAREAKFFVENHVLHRDITLTIEGIAGAAGGDKQDRQQGISFSGSIEFQGHDVAEELLKAGLAKYVAYSAAPRGADWVAKLKAAEKTAKDAKRRLWQNYEAKSESNGQKGVPSEFVGKVVSIQNTGAIAVIPEGQTKEVQVSISSIRTPKPEFPGDEEKDVNEKDKTKVMASKAERYWAAEGKELLRRRLIGQKVRVVYDYTRKATTADGDKKALPEKSYYTVYHGDQNIAVVLVESGLAQTMGYRSGEDRTADYEVLLMAEKKAVESKKGWHCPPEKVPTRRINDLCVDNNDSEKRTQQIARTKPFQAGFERAGPMKAIIDYVWSGARFKVTVPKQSAIFMFALSGIRVPKRGEGENGEELSNAALNFSREKLHQLEVTITVDGLDKGGNFVGSLLIGKKNFAVSLLEAGLAYLHYASAERLKDFKDLQTAEESAKSKKLGYWKNYDEEAEKAKLAAAAAEAGDIGPLQGKTIEVVVTEVVDGARMHVQIVGPESAGLDELVTQLTELSVSEGSAQPITVKAGDLVRGHFTDDDRWYRAKVQEVHGDKYKLLYIDYGNTETVPASRIRALPANSDLKALPAQAQIAALAFIKPLKDDSENAAEAKSYLREIAGGRKLQATVEYKDSGAVYLTLIDPSENNINIASDMIQQGLARLERSRKRHYGNPTYQSLRDAEEKAKQRRVGIWYYGDIPDSDEDERETPRKGAPVAGKDAKAAAAKKK